MEFYIQIPWNFISKFLCPFFLAVVPWNFMPKFHGTNWLNFEYQSKFHGPIWYSSNEMAFDRVPWANLIQFPGISITQVPWNIRAQFHGISQFHGTNWLRFMEFLLLKFHGTQVPWNNWAQFHGSSKFHGTNWHTFSI